jgi:hypothetical protein
MKAVSGNGKSSKKGNKFSSNRAVIIKLTATGCTSEDSRFCRSFKPNRAMRPPQGGLRLKRKDLLVFVNGKATLIN